MKIITDRARFALHERAFCPAAMSTIDVENFSRSPLRHWEIFAFHLESITRDELAGSQGSWKNFSSLGFTVQKKSDREDLRNEK